MFEYQIEADLSLKLIHINDAERIFELIENSRKYLREWLPWLDLNTELADSISFIENSLQGFAKNKSLDTVILSQNEIVGIAGFNQINWSNKTAYIGYWLGQEYQGKKIMTKVVQALTDYAFTELKLNKVEIRIASENLPSRKVPERLRFTNEGRIRQTEWLYDHFVDHLVYGMLAAEWKSMN